MKKQIILTIILICIKGYLNAQWQHVNIGRFEWTVIAIFTSGDTIYAAEENLHFSTDDGNNWISINNGLPDFGITSITKSGNYLLVGTHFNGIYMSDNNGSSWVPVNNGLTSLDIFDLAAKGNILFACTSSGVYISTNYGQQWVPVNNGLGNSNVYSVAFVGNRVLAASSYSYISDDYGQHWIPSNMPDTVYSYKYAVNGNHIYAITSHGIYLSSDAGMNWNNINNGMPLYHMPGVLSVATHDNAVFAGAIEDVYMSLDNGASWSPTGLGYSNVWALGATNLSLFAGVEPGGLYKLPFSPSIGVNEPSGHPIISIFPNPAYEMITISVPHRQCKHVTGLSICNIQGKMVLQQPIEDEVTNIDISMLSDGVYLCRVYASKNLFKCEKMVKVSR